MSGQRTTSGCWTCRIRRKKCDDEKPSCQNCTFRRLTCHGYGPKPAWMDSAENQKAEVERIKKAVNQNFRSRRVLRISKSSAPSSSKLKLSQEQKYFPSKLSYTDISDRLNDNVARLGELQLAKSKGVPVALMHPGSQYPVSNSSFQIPIQKSPQPDGTTTGSESFEAKAKVYPFSFHPDLPLAENEHELAQILHYLDKIFPLQYYFYQPASSERGRGWILSLLLRSRSSYYASLAFSCVSQILFVHQGNIRMQTKLSVDLDRYHSLALSELQSQLDILPTISGYEHLRLGVEILACMLQMMSIEVFRETTEWDGWKDDWEVHLQAAGALLSVIGTDLQTSSVSPASTSSSEEEIEPQHAPAGKQNLLPRNEIAGLDFFLTVYMWGDICRCASIGLSSSSIDSFVYLTYLEEDRVRLDTIMGCRNWAMIGIKKISILEKWKQEMLQFRTLSIPALARKAAELEGELHHGLDRLFKDQEKLSTYEQECNLVTQLYALSALIYLTVVVSGNSHLLPELRSTVSKTLESFKALPQHLLIRVSWPYCVAGCMAFDSQVEDFRLLLTDAHAAGHVLGTLWNGLEIMEEYWALRRDVELAHTSNKCAWALAMDSLGAKVLLI